MNTDQMTFVQLCELFAYTPKNRRLTTAEVAEVLGVKQNTLEMRRKSGGGPKYLKPPGSKFVSYTERDLLEYLAEGRYKSTAERSVRTRNHASQ